MGSRFNKELKTLVKDKVISPELADKIEQYYATKDIGKPNRLFTIFGVLGALLIGSGIILMLAHNWDDFSRITKTVLAFIPLLIGQFFVGFSILKDKSATWREASGTFLFFAVGACISLVSQIYNIPGNISSFLLVWIALCLPLIYVLRSHMIAILVVIWSTYYAAEVGFWNYRSHQTPWLYLLFMLLVIPHYLILLKQRLLSNVVTIFNWILPISFAIALPTIIGDKGDLILVAYITFYGLLYNIGRLEVFKSLRTLRNGYLIIGSLGTVSFLLTFTFRWLWEELPLKFEYGLQEMYISTVLFLIAFGLVIYHFIKKGIRQINLFQITFVLFTIVYFFLSSLEVVPVVLMNALAFSLGISAIRIGANKFNFGILNYGLLIISILIACRFFDTGMSFVLRGVLFVLVGIGFFVTNYMMLKKQQRIKKQLKDLQL